MADKHLSDVEERLTNLEKKVDAVLDALKDLKQKTTPIQSALPSPWGSFPVGDTRCSVCGIGSNGPMGYVCTRRDCPSGVVTCRT